MKFSLDNQDLFKVPNIFNFDTEFNKTEFAESEINHLRTCINFCKSCNHKDSYFLKAIDFAIHRYKELDDEYEHNLTEHDKQQSYTVFLSYCVKNSAQSVRLKLADYIKDKFNKPVLPIETYFNFLKVKRNKDTDEIVSITLNKSKYIDFAIDYFKLCRIENQLAIWNGIEFTQNLDIVINTLTSFLHEFGISFDVNEFVNTNLSQTNIPIKEVADPHVIPCLNYDLVIDKDNPNKITILNKDPNERVVVNAINVKIELEQDDLSNHGNEFYSWAERQKDPVLEKALNDWCNNDNQIRALLDEFIGALIYRSQTFKQTFMLYGEGNCGKSSFFKLLRTFICVHNTSDISLRQLSGHTSSTLQGKRLNISDDVGKQLDDEQHENLKKLISGDEITIDPKYKNPVTFKPQVKCIISCNSIPYFSGDTALYNRITFIPFEHKFENTGFKDGIKKDNKQFSALLVIALRGLARVLERQNNGQSLFSQSDRVKEKTEQVKCDASFLYEYLMQTNKRDELLKMPNTYRQSNNPNSGGNWYDVYTVKGHHKAFKLECKNNDAYSEKGQHVPNISTFKNKACEVLNLDTAKSNFYIVDNYQGTDIRKQALIFVKKAK
jgi:papillomavirus helicase